MNVPTQTTVATSALVVVSMFVIPAARAQEVDTSEWVCEFCPFESSHRADLTVGASNVSDDSAYFGDASGYSEEGAYANIDGNGSHVADGHRLTWQLEDLGLDSRYAELRGGQQGLYDYELAYRQIPRHRYYTSESIFLPSSGPLLALPSGWVSAPLTSGFTELDANLVRRDIESERRFLSIGGDYRPTNRVKLSLDYQRQERDGLDLFGGPYFTQSGLLPGAFDYTTDSAEIGIRYIADNGFVALGYRVSEFDGASASLTWDTPFTAAPGAESAGLALPPDNSFQQFSLIGNFRFTEYSTVIAYTAAIGNLEQDEPFLPYTTNDNLSVPSLPRGNLAGEIDTTNLAVSLTSRVFDKARLKMSYRYDERDNRTAQHAWARVIADTFVSGELITNTPYSYERSVFNLGAEYRLLDTVQVSGGYDRKTIDRDFQEVAAQTEDAAWGRLRWRPNEFVQLSARGGASERDADAYDETIAASLGQNQLMRKYNLAYRYRRFGELTATATLPEIPVSITINGMYADDDYSQSRLGLTQADDLKLAADLGWAKSENTSLYLTAGYENIESEQAGSETFSSPDWFASNSDDFITVGAGFRVRKIAEKLDLEVDFTRSDGTSGIEIISAASGSSRFPDIESTLDYLRAQLTWRRSARMHFDFNIRYQRFDAEDWALEGVEPATIPTVLTLGAEPYDDDIFLFGFGFRYVVGAAEESSE